MHVGVRTFGLPCHDNFWQTETGGILITPLPGAVEAKPGSATLALPGIDPEVYTPEGDPATAPDGGLLVLRKPWRVPIARSLPTATASCCMTDTARGT